MNVQTRTPKEPPCILLDTFPVIVYFDDRESSIIRNNSREIHAWCHDNLGKYAKDWGISIPNFDIDSEADDLWCQLVVQDEAAATMFALRWLC